MGQNLYPKRFPKIEVEQSWQEGVHHIALLVSGAYCHISGLPIKDEKELKQVLKGEQLEKALHWFRHRHDETEVQARRIIFEKDGTPVFEDDGTLPTPGDIMNFFEAGDMQNAALICLARKMDAVIEAERMASDTKAGGAAEKIRGKKAGGKKDDKGRFSKQAPPQEAGAGT